MNNESQIVLYQPDDSIRLEVKIDAGNETVWLNRNQIAELFGRDVKTIGKHINNALREELATETETNVSDVNNQNNPTVAKFATVQIEGGREVTRQVEYYNLDVILSVGYRVKSNRGIQFRRWSNTILKQYLLQGYSINRHLVALQERTDQRFADIEQRRLTLIRHSRTALFRSRYHLGASLNELSKRLFAFSRLQMDKEIITRSIISNQQSYRRTRFFLKGQRSHQTRW